MAICCTIETNILLRRNPRAHGTREGSQQELSGDTHGCRNPRAHGTREGSCRVWTCTFMKVAIHVLMEHVKARKEPSHSKNDCRNPRAHGTREGSLKGTSVASVIGRNPRAHGTREG